MDIPLLISGLSEIPSLSDPVKVLFDEELAISEISSAQDIDALLSMEKRVTAQAGNLRFTAVDLPVMAIHIQVIKPFVSQIDDEDDFI